MREDVRWTNPLAELDHDAPAGTQNTFDADTDNVQDSMFEDETTSQPMSSNQPSIRIKTRYRYTPDETQDMRFAFEACVPEETEKERGGKVIEDLLLYEILRALTRSDDSEDITRAEVQRLISKAKTAIAEKQAERASAKNFLAKGVTAVTSAVDTGVHAVGAASSKAAQIAHIDGLASRVRTLQVPFKGMLSKNNNHKSANNEVNFSEFFMVMTDEDTAKFLPDGNFVTAAFKIRVLKYAYGLIDDNNDGRLTYEDFALAADALSTTKISDQLATELWGVVAPGKARDDESVINFVEFVTGMADVQADPVYSHKFDLFETNMLLSMIVDLPVSKVEEKRLFAGMGRLERIGMRAAKRADHHQWSTTKRNEVMQNVQERTIHMLSDQQKTAMTSVHKRNVCQGAVAGFLSAVACALSENGLTYALRTDGTANPFHCIPEEVAELPECKLAANESVAICGCVGPTRLHQTIDPWATGVGGPNWHEHELWPHCDWKGILPIGCVDSKTGSNDACDYITAGECEATTDLTRIVGFWSILLSCIIMACIIEIGVLYWYSIKNSVKVADALDMHLDPLNKDRAFVGRSLVRAALELGNDHNVLFGIDPRRESGQGGACMVAVFTLVYKAKIVLTGFLMKIAIKRVLGRGGAKYALPWAAVPATAAWDAMVSHLVIVEAKLRGVGVATSVEMFQEILYDLDTSLADESDAFKMQLVRAVGCNVTKGRDIYPAKEILLRHIVSELGFAQLLEEKESGDLDNTELFLATMAELTGPEMKVVLEVLVLVTVLDGNAKKRERNLYEAALNVCAETEAGNQLVVHTDRVRKLAQDYRNMVPITKEAIQNCLDDSEYTMPMSYYWNECTHWCCSLLICI